MQEVMTHEAGALESAALAERYRDVLRATAGAALAAGHTREATAQKAAVKYAAVLAAAMGAATGAGHLGGAVASKIAASMAHAMVESAAPEEEALDAAAAEALRREVRAGIAEALAPLASLADALQRTMSKATETAALLQKRRAG